MIIQAHGPQGSIQIHGTKRVVIFPPSCTPYLYPALGARFPHISRLNFFHPDRAAFPLFDQAVPWQVVCDLSPGSMLYIPKTWWHAVESLSVSISVNIWWEDVAQSGTA